MDLAVEVKVVGIVLWRLVQEIVAMLTLFCDVHDFAILLTTEDTSLQYEVVAA